MKQVTIKAHVSLPLTALAGVWAGGGRKTCSSDACSVG